MSRLARTLILALLALVAANTHGEAQQPSPAAPPAASAPSAPQIAPEVAPASQPSSPSTPQPTSPAPPPAPSAAPAVAPPPLPPTLPIEITAQVGTMAGAIENAEKALQRLRDAGDDLGRLRQEADRIITETTRLADELRPKLQAARSQLNRLGPPPARDAPPEQPAIAAQRAKLQSSVSELDGAIKTLELTWGRARQLVERITDLRYALFTRSLMERTQSPLMPALWSRAARDLPSVWSFADYVARDWWASAMTQGGSLVALLVLAAGLWIGLLFVVRWLDAWSAADDTDPHPTFFERARRIAWLAPARMLPPLAALTVAFSGLQFLRLLYFPSDIIATGIYQGLALFIAIAALIWTALAPSDPRLGLIEAEPPQLRRIAWFLTAIAGVYALDSIISVVGRALVVPLSITVVQTFLSSIAFGALMVGLLVTSARASAAQPGTLASEAVAGAPIKSIWLRGPLWLMTALILGSTLSGYVALGRFAAQQLVLTGAVLIATWLGWLAIRAVTRPPPDRPNPLARLLETHLGLEESRRREIAFLLEVLGTALLLFIAAPLVLVQWGYSASDIRDWLKSAFFGFEIGQFRISLARILIGLALFAGLVFLTRLIQRWLRERVLVPRRVETGIAHSIETTLGYAGVALAILIALSYAGLDITSLAIVAGALSVGIGFGLQSIVNNFVSGLILLIERPVKVGDWIVVGDQQGNVRRISVRSTEIETFDRASLIIPNSELITGRVLNWTHRNILGRPVIRLSVSHDSDPERVIAILLQCARANPSVLTEPPPAASLDGFGANSLDFSLRIHIGDVTRGLTVQSELRIAILKSLREEGIRFPALPYPAPANAAKGP